MADNKLVTIHQNLEDLLRKKSEALPHNFNQTRFIQNAMAVLQDTPKIKEMEPRSVARTILKGAFLGLDFMNKECYAIPYGNSLQFQTDYKGEIKIAKSFSVNPILDIYAKVVREGDVFDEQIVDGKQSIAFNPKPFNDGKTIGAFAVCLFKDGSMLYETMSVSEMEHIRKKFSKQPNGKAWVDSTNEMYKKTVIRRLRKLITIELPSADAKKAEEEGQDVQFAEYEDVQEPIAMPQPKHSNDDTQTAPEPEEKDVEQELLASARQEISNMLVKFQEIRHTQLHQEVLTRNGVKKVSEINNIDLAQKVLEEMNAEIKAVKS